MKSNTQTRVFTTLFATFIILFFASCNREESINNNYLPSNNSNERTECCSSSAVGADAYNRRVAIEFSKFIVEASRYTFAKGVVPPISARALGYIGLSAYEAIIPGIPSYNSLANSYYRVPNMPGIDPTLDYHWPTSLAACYAAAIQTYYPIKEYPELLAKFNALQVGILTEFAKAVPRAKYERSRNFGVAVAKAIYAWSSLRGGHRAFENPTDASYTTGKRSPTDGLWQPTPPNFAPALLPYWGSVTPFAITNTDKWMATPIVYDGGDISSKYTFSNNKNSAFYEMAREVYSLSSNPTFENRWIAYFWSDDIGGFTLDPAARWLSIAIQVLEKKNANLATSVLGFARLGMSMCDAGIICWNTKYWQKLERPVDYIRRNIAPNYLTILNDPLRNIRGISPNFPAYASGHAAFGAAATRALETVVGNSFAFTDYTHRGRSEFLGTPRSFATLAAAAAENAFSRLPLGVHYRIDADMGIKEGYRCGDRVNALPWKRGAATSLAETLPDF